VTLCVNDSGTWREISTLCINDSGTWRNVGTGCINDSGTWREFGFAASIPDTPLGGEVEGGFLICKSSGTAWIAAPASTEVSRSWYSRNDAITTANAQAACGDWFLPSCGQYVSGPPYACRSFWDSYSSTTYHTTTEYDSNIVWGFNMGQTGSPAANLNLKEQVCCLRAFRIVSY